MRGEKSNHKDIGADDMSKANKRGWFKRADVDSLFKPGELVSYDNTFYIILSVDSITYDLGDLIEDRVTTVSTNKVDASATATDMDGIKEFIELHTPEEEISDELSNINNNYRSFVVTYGDKVPVEDLFKQPITDTTPVKDPKEISQEDIESKKDEYLEQYNKGEITEEQLQQYMSRYNSGKSWFRKAAEYTNVDYSVEDMEYNELELDALNHREYDSYIEAHRGEGGKSDEELYNIWRYVQ